MHSYDYYQYRMHAYCLAFFKRVNFGRKNMVEVESKPRACCVYYKCCVNSCSKHEVVYALACRATKQQQQQPLKWFEKDEEL